MKLATKSEFNIKETPRIKLRDFAKLGVEGFESGHRLCAGCGAGIIARQATLILKYLKKPHFVVNATGCMEVASTIYPYNSWNVPWMHNAFENAAATASGAIAAYEAMTRKGLEKLADPNVIIFGGDGGTFDIGLQSLSGAIERGHDFLYICYNNGAYMNTGIQRSGGTPKGASTTTSPAGKKIPGKPQYQKDLIQVMWGHDIPVFTASPAYPRDFMGKVIQGLEYKGPSFMLVDSPCNLGWKHDPSQTIKIAKLAVETAIFPLFKAYKDTWILTGVSARMAMKPDAKKPVEEYFKVQGRFKHLFKPENKHIIKEIQEYVDEKWERLVEKAKPNL